jgi:glucose/arabinose dehydrogenase
LLQGTQPVTVRIGYVYTAIYRSPAQLNQSFASFGSGLSRSQARQEITISQTYQTTVTHWDAAAEGLAEWNLSVQNAYDPVGRVLYLGDGSSESATALGARITTVAGTGVLGFSGDGGLATAAQLNQPHGVAVGPDGSLYIADSNTFRIRRVAPDGTITTVAGTGVFGFSGEGGPATAAQLNTPYGVAVGPDGSLYIADSNNFRIRRVAPDGTITTVAGTGVSGFGGDGGPATAA